MAAKNTTGSMATPFLLVAIGSALPVEDVGNLERLRIDLEDRAERRPASVEHFDPLPIHLDNPVGRDLAPLHGRRAAGNRHLLQIRVRSHPGTGHVLPCLFHDGPPRQASRAVSSGPTTVTHPSPRISRCDSERVWGEGTRPGSVYRHPSRLGSPIKPAAPTGFRSTPGAFVARAGHLLCVADRALVG